MNAMDRMGVLGFCPVRTGKRLKESSPASSGRRIFSISAVVARESVKHRSCDDVEPAAILPGQRAINGTRCPPSVHHMISNAAVEVIIPLCRAGKVALLFGRWQSARIRWKGRNGRGRQQSRQQPQFDLDRYQAPLHVREPIESPTCHP